MLEAQNMKRKNPEETMIQIKQFTLKEIDHAITKIERRVQEVEELREITLHSDPKVENVEDSIKETIREVYGQFSPEFIKYQHYAIWEGGYVIGDSFLEKQTKFQSGIEHAIGMLNGLIGRLAEKKFDLQQDPDSLKIQTFNGLNLHPRISNVCLNLYKDGHFSSAVFEASKSLINYVKEKSKKHDLDGTNLVRTVFSRNKPILSFNKLIDQTDLDEQEGIMHLFEGAVMGIRNPRGHGNITDDPDRAMDYIILISLLAYRVDNSSSVLRED